MNENGKWRLAPAYDLTFSPSPGGYHSLSVANTYQDIGKKDLLKLASYFGINNGNEIIDHVKEQIDNVIEEWGYHLHDLQINDITFDEAVMRSMSQVVASSNLKAAAENEGQALLITKTKAAEADGNAIKIAAQAEREAAQLRGQGVALFREEVAKGMQNAAREMQQANLDTSMIMFSMWTEAIKNFAEYGKGNVIFLDGSPDGMQKVMKQMMGMDTLLDISKKTD